LFYAFSEQVYEGLERAIMTMKKEEQALVTINAEYLCDNSNLQGNKANNNKIYFEVELIDFTKVRYFYVLLI
jgi:FK506-binding protein 4/5